MANRPAIEERPFNMKRVMKDVKQAMEDPLYDFIYDEEGLFGPKLTCYARFKMQDTPFKGQVHIISMKFSHKHPMEAPTVNFITPVFHSNVSHGGICLDILSNQWTPMYTLTHVVLSIIALLGDPNPDSALNSTAARLWRSIIKARKNGDKAAIAKAEEAYADEALAYYESKINSINKAIWNAWPVQKTEPEVEAITTSMTSTKQ